MPISRQARTIRTAISPRFAIRILRNMSEFRIVIGSSRGHELRRRGAPFKPSVGLSGAVVTSQRKFPLKPKEGLNGAPGATIETIRSNKKPLAGARGFTPAEGGRDPTR